MHRSVGGLLYAVSIAACSGQSVARKASEVETRDIAAVLAAHNASLMAMPGVTGTAIGLCDGVPCIRVFVADSAAAAAGRDRLGARLDGHPVRVEVTGAFRALPTVLQIYHERLNAGAEDAFARIEEEIARICRERHCPHPYLGAVSVERPTEVWWFNAHLSEQDRQQVARAWAADTTLMRELTELPRRKRALVADTAEVIAAYRADLSRGVSWQVEGARFLVIRVSREDSQAGEVAVFEGPDGARYAVGSASRRSDADRLATAMGTGSRIFAIRPEWSMPAPAWVAADPGFWASAR